MSLPSQAQAKSMSLWMPYVFGPVNYTRNLLLPHCELMTSVNSKYMQENNCFSEEQLCAQLSAL